MRNRWDHESPEDHQPTPRDNTSRYVLAQVSRWLRTGEPIHPESAMEIAAWWHSPASRDQAITAFASHGEVRKDDLLENVRWCQGQANRAVLGESASINALVDYVEKVQDHLTRYRRHLWHGGGHRWMSTGTTDEDSCLTCGVLAELRPDAEEGDYGSYFGGNGEPIIACTGRTDIVHGYERHCEADNGRECEPARDTGNCAHTDHECNCLQCG